jgi:hypothetical protein
MDHLQGLGKVNGAYAWFTGLIGLVSVIGLAVMASVSQSDDAALAQLLAGTAALATMIVVAEVLLLVATAKRVEQGRWRLVQTVLAGLSVASNPPVGTAYGLYALWVCWVEPASKAAFEPPPGGAPQPRSPASAGNRPYKIVMKLIVIFGVLYALLAVATFVGVGWLMSWGGQQTEFSTTDTQVVISGMYGEEILRSDITQIDLRDELPTITMRTNGYALGDTLKGWFATEELGKVKLFVHADSPPFIYVQTSDHWLIYGASDPAQTRARYDELAETR